MSCVAAVSAALLNPGPAAATVLGPCERTDGGLRYCSFQNDSRTERVFVEIEIDGGLSGIVYSQVNRFNASAGATVFVQQCRGDGTACSTISANNGTSVYTVRTSKKAGQRNHVYRTCASWTTTSGWHEVNRCSPFYAV